MFLIQQRLPKEIYVGTTVLVFAWINWIKFAFFIPAKIITLQTAAYSASLLSFVPLGVWCGLLLNKRIPEQIFIKFVYLFTFLAGLR
jgi:hypothetical protein